jgi:hypothetical protein
MGKRLAIIAALFVAVVTGCAPAVPQWRDEARMILDKTRQDGADRMLPAEFHSVEDTLHKGDVLLHQDDVEHADEFYRLALLKGRLLETDLAAEKQRLAEEARRKAEEEQREQARLKALQVEEERRRQAEEKERLVLIQAEKERRKKEKERSLPLPLPTHHTVKSGETLPLIAALPDVYNDSALWPLLYRSNRDQIRDPKRIWPGQVLRIPRNLSREDIAEARRYGQEKPLR